MSRSALQKFSLAGKVAIVTGSGRGIGRAIALALAEAGADVVLTSRTREEIENVASEVRKLNRRALPIVADVSQAQSATNLVEQTVKALGTLDILVNNAGISPYFKRVEDLTEAEWDQVIGVNLKGAFLCSREAGKQMIAQRGGVILNVASVAGLIGVSHLCSYSVSKAGLLQLTRALALEWAKHGIRVNTIVPGWVMTQMSQPVLTHEKIGPALLAQVPMGRAAQPEEIAGLAVYLASDAARFVTGQAFIIDGGQMLL
jgi:gluconate 5-dehydrogenase